jgi:hypothetical protein
MTTTRVLSLVAILALFAIPANAEEYKMERPAAEEFCGHFVSVDTTHFHHCVRAFVEGTDSELLNQMQLTAEVISPETYPTLRGAIVAPTLPDPLVTLSFNAKVSDLYLGGNGGVFHDGPVSQNDVTANFRNGCSVNFWISQGFDLQFSSGFDDEIDYSGWCAGSRYGVDIEAGVIYIDAVNLGHSPNGDVWGPYLKLSRSTESGWGSSIKFEPYIPGGSAVEGGWLIHGRVSYGRKLFGDAVATLSVGPTYDDGAFGFRPGIIGFAALDLSIPWRGTTLGLFYKIATPIKGASDRQTEDVYGLTLGF